jgi:hypothetical protein
MKRRYAIRQARTNSHRGMASLEVVMTMAVMVPLAGAMLFLGIKMCAMLYQVIGTLVGWPYV